MHITIESFRTTLDTLSQYIVLLSNMSFPVEYLINMEYDLIAVKFI